MNAIYHGIDGSVQFRSVNYAFGIKYLLIEINCLGNQVNCMREVTKLY
jgi:hypothetical protein